MTVSPSHLPEARPTPNVPLDAAAWAVLQPLIDPGGRALVAVIEPEEAIEATVDVVEPRAVAAAADTAEFHAEVVNDGTALIVGRRDNVLGFIAHVAPTRVGIAEDHRVDRWLPDARPTVEIPSPGAPYRLGGLDADTSRLTMTDGQRAVLLSDFALTTVTIDGRRYERLSVEGDCDPDPPTGLLCQLWATGSTGGAGGRDDQILIRLATGRGVHAVASTNRESVPRALVRTAEWVARHDATAAGVVARYDRCCFGSWDPRRPGVITIGWTRECAAAAGPAVVELADTGDCSDLLEIDVDLRLASVTSVHEVAGP